MTIPKKVADRIKEALKHLVPLVEQQRSRDVSEADTVTLVRGLLSDAFGFDRYTEMTGEFAIRGTYCDLALRVDDKVIELVEVKAIGISLNDRHLKQAVDYAANQGIEWVILTNAVTWQLYNVVFAKPIDKRLVAELDITDCDPRRDSDLELLYLFTKEGFRKGAPTEARDRQDASSRFLLAALLLHDPDVLAALRRELRRVVDVLVPDQDILRVLREEVVKRDAMEGPEAEKAERRIQKADTKRLRRKRKGSPAVPTPDTDKVDEDGDTDQQ